MADTNKQGSGKQSDEMRKPPSVKAASGSKPAANAAAQPTTARSSGGKSKQSPKGSRPKVGGTAAPGARSTQPKEFSSTNNPQQQQVESYNRMMRRRMEHLGTGPSQSAPMDQRQKRLQKRKKRLEERRQEVKKVAASGPRKITLGRRNTYFLIAVVAVIIIVIAIAIFINNFR